MRLSVVLSDSVSILNRTTVYLNHEVASVFDDNIHKIADLLNNRESSMDPEFWHGRWRENKIGFHQQEFNTHLTQYWHKLGLSPGQGVFVPLCGKSHDLTWLDQQGHPVLGNEISEVAVKAYFEENGLQVQQQQKDHHSLWYKGALKIICGDFFDLMPADLQGVKGVYDRASLVALPTESRQRYVQHLATLLEKEAKILLVTLDYPQNEMQGPPFAVTESEVERLYRPYFNIEKVYDQDILNMDENARFKSQGLTHMSEKVFLLTPL